MGLCGAMAEEDIDSIQSKSKAKIAEFERTMMGMEKEDRDSTNEGSEASEIDQSNTEAGANTPELTDSSDSDASTQNSSEDYSTSKSHADPKFADSAQESASKELAPLFVASIICKSRVDDTMVLRPERLRPGDKWEVEYLLQEWDINEAIWARYADVKTKRKQIFEKYKEEEVDENAGNGGEGEKMKRDSGYIDFLKSMSQKGKEFRGRMDQLEAGKEAVVVGQPLYASNEAAEEVIENVDQYMDWMYQKRP